MKSDKSDLSSREATTLRNGGNLDRMSVWKISKIKDTALHANLRKLGQNLILSPVIMKMYNNQRML